MARAQKYINRRKREGFFILLFLSFFGYVNAQQVSLADTLQIALVQITPAWGDVEKNLENYAERIAACTDCDLIVLPEFFTSGATMERRTAAESAVRRDRIADYYSRIVEIMQEWAMHQGALILGSTIYKEDGKYYNRLVAAFPDGRTEFYDKHNCFQRGSYTPGDRHVVLDYRGLKIATYICYDLRFPEWSNNTMGYDMAVYVANWPFSRHADWESLLRERAISNQAIIVGVNCVGEDPSGLKYAGESLILDSQGEIVARGGQFIEQIVETKIGIPSVE